MYYLYYQYNIYNFKRVRLLLTMAVFMRAEREKQKQQRASRKDALNQGKPLRGWRLRNSWIGGKQGFSDRCWAASPCKSPQSSGDGPTIVFATLPYMQ